MIRFLWLVLPLVLHAPPLPAQTPSPSPPAGMPPAKASLEQVLHHMDGVYQSLVTYQAEFEQVSETKAFQRKRRSTGKLYFKKPDRMRWTYEAPEKRDIYLVGQRIQIYLPSQNQVLQQQLNEALPGMAPARLFMGVAHLLETFNVALLPEKDQGAETCCLRLTPKTRKGMSVEELLLWVDRQDWLPRKTESRDVLGNQTTLVFRNGKVDADLDDALFRFTIPPGTEIVDGML